MKNKRMLSIKSVSDNSAESILKYTINSIKSSGRSDVDIIDLHTETSLPLEQISRLMEKFEKEGVVSDHESETRCCAC